MTARETFVKFLTTKILKKKRVLAIISLLPENAKKPRYFHELFDLSNGGTLKLSSVYPVWVGLMSHENCHVVLLNTVQFSDYLYAEKAHRFSGSAGSHSVSFSQNDRTSLCENSSMGP